MLGFQVASRATRDALFLSNFRVTSMPAMIVPAALASIPVVLVFSRLLARYGPGRLGPPVFLVSAGLVAALWAMAGVAPQVVAVLLWLHVAVVAPIAISCFYSLLAESFEPRTAKRALGRIIAFGTLGGLMGGILAERIGSMAGLTEVLPVLVAIHAGCAWGMHRLAAGMPSTPHPPESVDLHTGMAAIARDTYIRNVALLVGLSGVAGTLLDYVFKAQVSAVAPAGPELIRLFSAFYTGVSLLTFLVQSLASRPMLERAGVASTAATMPAAIALGSLGALVAPGVLSVGIARGLDLVVRSGLFRPAYELLHTPLPPTARRSTKILVDVGCDRLADAVGGLLVAAVIAFAGGASRGVLLGGAALLGAAGLVVARGFRRGYVEKLEARLVGGAQDVLPVAPDATLFIDLAVHGLDPTRGVEGGMLTSQLDRAKLGALGLHAVADPGMPPGAALGTDTGTVPTPNPRAGAVPGVSAGAAGEARLALEDTNFDALHRRGPPGPESLARFLPELAIDERAAGVLAWLRRATPSVAGQIADFLLDSTQPLPARRRTPRILAHLETPLAVEALFLGLEDPRFEIRVQCGRGLLAVREMRSRRVATGGEDPSPFPADRVFAAVLREVEVDRGVWEARRSLKVLDEGDEDAQLFDVVVRERAGASLEHVFTLLALALPRRPVSIAFQGLQATDAMYRGMALEYLESVLPARVRDRLWPFLEERGRRAPASRAPASRAPEEIARDLLVANQSMQIRLDELKRHGIGEEPTEP